MIRHDIKVSAVCVRAESPTETEFRFQFRTLDEARTIYTFVLTAEQFANALTAKVVDGVTMEVRQKLSADVELDALRARIKSLEGCIVRNMEAAISRIPKAGAARFDPVMAALARASQERDDARADLREAMELLDMAEAPPDHENGGDLELWNHRRAVLRGAVEKRKETP